MNKPLLFLVGCIVIGTLVGYLYTKYKVKNYLEWLMTLNQADWKDEYEIVQEMARIKKIQAPYFLSSIFDYDIIMLTIEGFVEERGSNNNDDHSYDKRRYRLTSAGEMKKEELLHTTFV